MKIRDFRLVGIRCFEDTGDIPSDPKCNIFVRKNNTGKSSVLKAILGLQGFPFDGVDVRQGQVNSFVTLFFDGIRPTDNMNPSRPPNQTTWRTTAVHAGNLPEYPSPLTCSPELTSLES